LQLLLDTAFKQQRLKAWQPILTPKTVLPTFILVGILFAPIGGLLLWASDTVSTHTLLYCLSAFCLLALYTPCFVHYSAADDPNKGIRIAHVG
jgi:hypothetical protein